MRDARRWSRLANEDRISSGVVGELLLDAAARIGGVMVVKYLDWAAVHAFANEFRRVMQRQCFSRIGATLLRSCRAL